MTETHASAPPSPGRAGGGNDAQQTVLAKVAKLLQLAAKAGTEAEAASAAAKANELMEAYNITTSQLERAQGALSGKREQAAQAGGMYEYQRRLWHWVAELNFCVYWHGRKLTLCPDKKYRRRSFHQLVGRTVNVAAARALGEYLQQAVERLCRERLHEKGEGSAQFYSRWAVSYREGVSDAICLKLSERRELKLSEARAEAEAQAQRAMQGTSTATALTLRDVVEREREANLDFVFGEGYSAKRAAERARQAKAEAEADAEYAQWAAAHPEEARAQAEKDRRKNERSARRSFAKEKPTDWGAYSAGREAGRGVSIDLQADDAKHRRLTHG